MSSALYTATAIKFGASSTICGITKSAHDPRNKTKVFGNSGSLHNRLAIIEKTAPMISFSTLSVASLLTLFANTDTPMLALNGSTVFCEKYSIKGKADGPGIDTTGHGLAKILNGQAYLDKLSWYDGSHLTADVSVFGLSTDGATHPLVESTVASGSLPTLTQDEVYELVSATQAGTSIDGLSSLEVNFKHNAANDNPACYSFGLPHPTRIITAGVGGPIEVSGTFETSDLSQSIPSTALTLAFGFKPYIFGGTFGSLKTLSILLAMVSQSPEDLDTASPGKQKFSFVGTITAGTYPWSWA